MIVRILCLSFAIGSAFAVAAPKREVIDLGSLKIEGAARGPEIHVVDMGLLGPETAERFLLEDLKRLEHQLLTTPANEPLRAVKEEGEKAQ